MIVLIVVRDFSSVAPVSYRLPHYPNFLSEWCRCGDDMKKPWMDSTKAYIPFRALIEAPLSQEI